MRRRDRTSLQYLVDDVRDHNPWWEVDPGEIDESSEPFADVPTTRKSDYYFHVGIPGEDGLTTGQFQSNDVFVLTGRRGVGKTTLLRQFVRDEIVHDGYDPRQFVYVPFDEPLYQIDSGTQLQQAMNYYERRVLSKVDSDEHYLLLDDVHAIERRTSDRGWAETVVSLLDDHPDLHVVVTGIVDETLTADLRGAGLDANRFDGLPLLPEKFSDYVRFELGDGDDLPYDRSSLKADGDGSLWRAIETGDPAPFVENLQRQHRELDAYAADVRARLDDYLAKGGILTLRERARGAALDEPDYESFLTEVRLAIYQEVPKIERVRTIADLERLLSYVARMGPETEFQFNHLTGMFDVDRRTLRNSYFEPLRKLFLLTPSPEFDNERPRDTRLYVRDPGLVNVLNGTTAEEVYRDIDVESRLALATAFDHTARLEFRLRRAAADEHDHVGPYEKPSVSYRRMGDAVVDFVVEVPTAGGSCPLPVGVAYRPDVAGRVRDALEQFCATYDAPFGLFVTSDIATPDETVGSVENSPLVGIPYWFYLMMA